MDNVGCNDYKELNCDYFDVVPSDIGVLHNINLELEGADGVQIAAIEVKYNDNIARFDGINDNDCISVQGWETDYP